MAGINLNKKIDRHPDQVGLFQYEAITPTGARIKGPKAKMNAFTAAEVRTELVDQGYFPIKIKEIPSSTTAGSIGNISFGGGLKLKPAAVAGFARGFYQLLRAGISVPRAIEALGEDASNPALAAACATMSNNIANGMSISEAFAEYPKAFDNVFCGYLAAGEETGNLTTALGRLTALTEKRSQLKSKIRAVTAYPIMVSSVIGIMITGIILFLVPRYEQIYAQFNAKLPVPTQLLVQFSHHFFPVHFFHFSFLPFPLPGPNFASPLLYVLAAYIGISWFLRAKKDDPKVGAMFDKIKFRLPVAGELTHQLVLYRWTSTLAGALGSNVQTVGALQLAAQSSGSRWLRTISPEIEEGLQNGKPLSDLLANYPELFPPNVRTMIATGESSGETASMLEAVSVALSDEIDAIVGTLSAKIEVALLLGLGVVVGSMLVALYLPILNLAATVSNTDPSTATTTTTTTAAP